MANNDGICIAISHGGSRCSTAVESGAIKCPHHLRMERLLALAPKASQSSSPSTLRSFSSNSIDTKIHNMNTVNYRTDDIGIRQSMNTTYPNQVLSSPISTINSAYTLLGESIVSRINCSFTFPSTIPLAPVQGTLIITNFRLRFEPQQQALRSPGHVHRLLDGAIIGLPLATVSKLSYPQSSDKRPATVGSKQAMQGTMGFNINMTGLSIGRNNSPSMALYTPVPVSIIVSFKDLRTWSFSGDTATLMTTLVRYIAIESPLSVFAFVPFPGMERLQEHHNMYDVLTDFKEMGIDLSPQNSSNYRLATLNRDYSLCLTYPSQFVVPASTTDYELQEVSRYRSKGRIPICSYVNSRTNASIWRSAQPKRGIFNSQSSYDAQYLQAISRTSKTRNSHPVLLIADCRPELNARVNNFTGGGTESTNESHTQVQFLDIANIHAMRESLQSLKLLSQSAYRIGEAQWLARVEETKWLDHIRLVLQGSYTVAEALENQQQTVLVHCSDGWDRTAQISSIAQILLDSRYRTMTGFMKLIEKEWLNVGHKFHDRIGLGVVPPKGDVNGSTTIDDEQSPVFIQFLDCVWQLVQQFPTRFEFLPSMLVSICDSVFSGQFGTFLGNSERERAMWNVSSRTPSFWSYILKDKREIFRNPFYDEIAVQSTNGHNHLLVSSSIVQRNVALWVDFYFRGATSPSTINEQVGEDSIVDERALIMQMACKKIAELEKEIAQLKPSKMTFAPHIPLQRVSHQSHSAPIQIPETVNTPTKEESFPVFSKQSSSSSVSPPEKSNSTNSQTEKSDGSWRCTICLKMNNKGNATCSICGCAPMPTS